MTAGTMGDDRGMHPTWRLDEPWPTTLVAPLSVMEHPEPDALLAAIAARLDEAVEVLELQPSSDDRHPWSLVIRVPGHDVPVLLACERTKRMDEIRPDLREGVVASRWSLIVESLLDPVRPAAAWAMLAGLLLDEASAVALLDATTGRWFDRHELRSDVLDPDLGPPTDVLWRVQVVSDSAELENGTAWLMTRGLLRCGLPELELLELPASHARSGARLLDAVAELMLEDGPPPPEVPYPIGDEIAVTFVPWAEVVETLDASSLGSDADRRALSQETPNPLRARRAVVCDLEPRGSFRPVWSWPRDAIARLDLPDAAIRRSVAASTRLARIARRRWPEAIAAHRGSTSGGEVLLVGTVVERDDAGGIEHGWIQVDRADERGGEGRLLRDTTAGRRAGTVHAFAADAIDDWRLIAGERAAGPEHAATVAAQLGREEDA
jgi:hypothetical protein